jgi:glycosyltransferase involved in cell wall biosynthesis
MNKRPFISIIIPVYNGDHLLGPSLEKIIHYMQRVHPYQYEIIIVNNGSTDDTQFICDVYTHTYNHIYALHLEERGKGLAVQRGMLFAQGYWRYMCDVDLSTPIEELSKFLKASEWWDVVIGSREIFREEVTTTPTRRIIGRVFHTLVADLVPGVADTQCGFKIFSDRAAEEIFSRLHTHGMAFDVEVLYLAKLHGFFVNEIPVRWVHNSDSRVRLFQDSLQMALDVLQIPWLHMREKVPA